MRNSHDIKLLELTRSDAIHYDMRSIGEVMSEVSTIDWKERKVAGKNEKMRDMLTQ